MTVQKLTDGLVKYVFLIIWLSVTIPALILRHSISDFVGYVLVFLFLTGGGEGCAVLLSKKKSRLPLWIIVIAVSTLLKLYFVIRLNVVQVSDQETLLDAAKQINSGNYQAFQNGYFYNWAYQIPFVLYESLILKIFNTEMALKLLNILFSSGICVLVYLIGKRVFGKAAGYYGLFVYAFYPMSILYCSVLTNQTIAAFFFYMGIYIILLPGGGGKKACASGIILSISGLMRPEGALTFLLIGGVLTWKIVHDKKKLSMTCIRMAILFAVVYFGVFGLASQTIVKTGLSREGVKNNCPEWKFILGLDKDTDGGYNEKYLYVLQGERKDPQRQEAIRDALENEWRQFHGVSDFIFFLGKKHIKMWCGNEPVGWLYRNVTDMSVWERDTLAKLAVNTADIYYIVMWILLLGYIVLERDVMKTSSYCNAVWLLFYFIITVGIYLVIERQTRYRFTVMPVIAILDGYSVSRIASRMPGNSIA